MSDQVKKQDYPISLPEVAALANLISIRMRCQLDARSMAEDFDAKYFNDLDDLTFEASLLKVNSAGDMAAAGFGGSYGNHMLRTIFLNRLSELLARKKGDSHVSRAILREHEQEGRVDIWVARNCGLDDSDYQLLSMIETTLSSLSKGHPDPESCAEEMWKAILQYYRPRLQEYLGDHEVLIQSSHQQIKEVISISPATLSETQKAFQSIFADLDGICSGRGESKTLKDTQLSELVKRAFELRVVKDGRQELDALIGDAKLAEKLHFSVCFLGRLRAAYRVFVTFAAISPTFSIVNIHSVQVCNAIVRSSRSLGISQILRILELEPSDATFARHISNKMSLQEATLILEALNKQLTYVHAEIQILYHLTERDLKSVYPFIGGSKESCFVCYQFFEAYGGIDTWGSQWDLQSDWIVPGTENLSEKRARKMSSVLATLFEELKGHLLYPLAESDEIAGHVTSLFRDDTGHTGSILTSADYLMEDLIADRLPSRLDVRQDFGFHRLQNVEDRSKLLGLYQGLRLLRVRADNLNTWRVEGTLIPNIIKVFLDVPKQLRGEYYPWFIKNQHVLDGCNTKEDYIRKTIQASFAEAKQFLDAEDQSKAIPEDLFPAAKRQAFIFITVLLGNSYPPPKVLGPSYEFGFGCTNESTEFHLGSLYGQLVIGNRKPSNFWNTPNAVSGPDQAICTFNEFWKAYESGSLIVLMDKYGFEEDRKSFPDLEQFLSYPFDASRPPVWMLMAFVKDEEQIEPPVGLADYGFVSSRGTLQIMTLKHVYRRVLEKAKPMELQEACVQGRLFEFVSGLVEVDECMKSLMQNA